MWYGHVARTAAPRVGTAGSVTGVDINDEMLSVARRVSPDLEWRRGDAAALPFEDAEFDVVLSQMAMMFFSDPATALREMARVVRPAGTVAILIPAGLDANPAYQAFVDIVTRHAGPAARNLVSMYFTLGDLARTTDLFTAAGLRVTLRSTPSGLSRHGSLDEAINVEIDSTPLGDGLDPAVRERILTECRDAFAPMVTASDHVPGGWHFPSGVTSSWPSGEWPLGPGVGALHQGSVGQAAGSSGSRSSVRDMACRPATLASQPSTTPATAAPRSQPHGFAGRRPARASKAALVRRRASCVVEVTRLDASSTMCAARRLADRAESPAPSTADTMLSQAWLAIRSASCRRDLFIPIIVSSCRWRTPLRCPQAVRAKPRGPCGTGNSCET